MVMLNKPSHPILLTAMFSVADDLGKMDVIVTTLKESIKLTLTLTEPAPESFELCCPVSMLLKIIGKLDHDQPTGLDFNSKTNMITITQGNGKFSILGRGADEFPAMDELKGTNDPLLELDTTYLIPALSSAKNHSSKDQTKQTLTATHIEFRKVGNEQLLYITGTDGHRANRIILGDIDLDMTYTPKPKTNYAIGLNWNIPRIVIDLIEKFNRMYPQETIKIREDIKDDTKFLIFHLGELMISCESIWGEYPSVDHFITDSGYTIYRLFDKSKLQHTLDRLCVLSDFISSKSTPQLFMNISPDNSEVRVRTSEKNILGQGSESIGSTIKDDRTLFTDSITLAINSDYITQAIRQLGSCSEVGVKVFVENGYPSKMLVNPIGFNYQNEIAIALIQLKD